MGVAVLLVVAVPPPPQAAAEEWLAAGRPRLVWSDELLFFGTLSWGAGLLALRARSGRDPHLPLQVGSAAIDIALVALIVVLLAIGRLVYPISDHTLDRNALILLIDTTYAALHLAMLGFAVGVIALVGLRQDGRRRSIRSVLGWLLGVVLLLGSFPWVTAPWFNVAVSILLCTAGPLIANGLLDVPDLDALARTTGSG